jgi:phosphoribosylanthranilate isomerase
MTKLKICGITRLADLVAAQELGADFIGFIFHPASPRYLDPRQLAAWRPYKLPSCHWVGVFVNAAASAIAETSRYCALDIVQLHGEETPVVYAAVRQLLGPTAEPRCWKALRPRSSAEIAVMDRYPAIPILLDSGSGTTRGGSGIPMNLELAAMAMQASAVTGRKVILAGGISATNLALYLNLKPWCIDVSSSIEDQPGIKNHDKLAALFKTFKAVQSAGTFQASQSSNATIPSPGVAP